MVPVRRARAARQNPKARAAAEEIIELFLVFLQAEQVCRMGRRFLERRTCRLAGHDIGSVCFLVG